MNEYVTDKERPKEKVFQNGSKITDTSQKNKSLEERLEEIAKGMKILMDKRNWYWNHYQTPPQYQNYHQ